MKSFDVSRINLLLIILLSFFLINHTLKCQNVVINEVMSSNSTTIKDEFGDYPDWIELYNTTTNTIDLSSFGLSDDPDEPDSWIFPGIFIEPHGYLLIFASARDTSGTIDLHANFKINSEGETIVLSNDNGVLIDELEIVALGQDLSFGRITDGEAELETFYRSSPKFSNVENSILNILSVSHEPGIYTKKIQFAIFASRNNNSIHFTLDGSEPTIASPIYKNTLLFTSRASENYTISGIPTTPLNGEWQLEEFIWEKPKQDINLVNVIRYRSFSENKPTSNTFSGTYFIQENLWSNHTFPIISIITDKENLFNYDTGIYIPGKRYDLYGWDWHPDGNYMNNGFEWERKCHVEFYEPGGSLGFSQNCGLRIHGGWSAKMPQKSLRIIARYIYGENKFKHQLFPDLQSDRYKDLVLRNSGNDFIYSHIRDAFMQELLSGLDLELQSFRPSVLYINGEYWGLHGLRERYDEDYFLRHFSTDEDDLIVVSVCGQAEIGDNSSYASMMNFVRNNNLSVQGNYDSIQKMIDIPNFIDYYIAQIYYANFDWPDNNAKMWKATDPSSKWRCLTYDLDGGYGFINHYDYNMLREVVDTTNTIYDLCSTNLFRNLLKNTSFKEQFIIRFVYHLQTTFHTDTVIDILYKYQELLESEMTNHINRWSYPININQWRAELQIMKDFASYRPCYCKDHLMDVFELEELDFDCDLKDFTNEDSELQLDIYPNPATDYLYFTIKKFDQEYFTINLYNVNGQKIYNQSMWLGRYKTAEIRTDHLNAGLYILSVNNGDLIINKKIIIE